MPPKCLFPPETRVNLITVPACPTCHDTFKLDDEYFRNTLSFHPALPEGVASEYLREKTRRARSGPSLNKPKTIVEIAIPKLEGAGLIEHPQILINGLDASRIKSTARRIIVGLYGSYMGQPLPETHEITVTVLDFQKDLSGVSHPNVQEVLSLLGKHGFHRRFDEVFELRFLPTDEDKKSSLWWGNLHEAFGFLGYAVPRDA